MKPTKDSTKPAARKDKKQAPRAKPPRAPGKKRSWLVRVLKVLLILFSLLVVLVVGAGVILQYFFPGETIRPIAEERLTAILKMPVTIGKVQFNLLKGVQISQVTLGGEEKFFSVEEVTLDYDLSELIQGKLTINRVIVDKPEVNLVSRNGVWNFQPLLGAAESSPPEADSKPGDAQFFLPFTVDLKQFIIKDISLSVRIDDQMLAHIEGLTIKASGKAGLSEINANAQVIMQAPENPDTPYNISFLSREGEGVNVRTLLLADLKFSADSIQSGSVAGTVRLRHSYVKMGQILPAPEINVQVEASADLARQTVSLQKLLIKIGDNNEVDLSVQVENFLGDPGFKFQLHRARLDFGELLALAGDLAPPVVANGVAQVTGLEGSGQIKDNLLEKFSINKGEIVIKDFSAEYPELDASADGVSARIDLQGIQLDKLVPQQVKAAMTLQARNVKVGAIAIRGMTQKLDIVAEGPNLLRANVNFSINLTEASYTHPDLGELKTSAIVSGSATGHFAAGDIKAFQIGYGFGKAATGSVSGSLKDFGKKGFRLNYILNAALAKLRELIPAKLTEEAGLEQLSGKVHVDSRLTGRVGKDFMPVNIQGKTNIKLTGVNVSLNKPALTVKGLDLATSIPAHFSAKKGIKIPALSIQAAIKELQALDNYSLGAVSAKIKFSLNKFVALKEPYGELPVKLDTEIQVGSIKAKEPRIALAGLKLNMNADSKISPAKEARNVNLVGKLSLASVEAMDMVTTGAIAVDFKLGVNDLSLTRTKAEISVSVKSPMLKKDGMEIGFEKFELTSVTRLNLKTGDIDIDSVDIRLPSIIGLTVKGHLKNWGEKFSIASKIPKFSLKSVLDKLPPAVGDKLTGLEIDGTVSFDLRADGKLPDAKAIRKMDIPVTLDSKFKLANFKLSWPEKNLSVENLNIRQHVTLKNNETNLSGKIAIGKVTYGDLLGKDGLNPEWDFHFLLENWDKLTIKKHHLSLANRGFNESVSGRVEGLKEFLSGKRAWELPELLRRLEISLSAKNSVEIDKALPMIKGVEASGVFAAQMNFDLAPGKEVSAEGSLEFKNFNAKYGKTASVNGIDGKFLFSKRLFLNRELLAAQPKAFSAARKGFFNRLRDFSQYKNIFRIASVEFDAHKASDIGLDIFFKDDRLVIEKFLLDVLGGSVAGNMFLVQTKEGPSLKFFTEFAGLDFNKLLGEKSAKGGEEAEVDGSLQFEFQINKGKAGDKISLDQIKLKIFITRIGEETLDRILLFLDPEESKPAIVDIRSKLKLASPHKVIISLENGNLNLKAWLKAKILGGSIIEAPELKRIPVTSMKPFRDILEQIQVMSQFQLILNYLAAQGMEFDEDGKLVLF